MNHLPLEIIEHILSFISNVDTGISFCGINNKFRQIGKTFIFKLSNNNKEFSYPIEILDLFPNIKYVLASIGIKSNDDLQKLQKYTNLKFFEIIIKYRITNLGIANCLYNLDFLHNRKCCINQFYNEVDSELVRVWLGNQQLTTETVRLAPFIFMGKEWIETLLIDYKIMLDDSLQMYISLLPSLKRIDFIDTDFSHEMMLSLLHLNHRVESIRCFGFSDKTLEETNLFATKLNFYSETLKELILPFDKSVIPLIKDFFPNLTSIGVDKSESEIRSLFSFRRIDKSFTFKNTKNIENIRDEWFFKNEI